LLLLLHVIGPSFLSDVKEELLDPCIKIISYVPNRGKSHAVKTGVMRASGGIIIFVDGDFDILMIRLKNTSTNLGIVI
jgi:glycosyltransferase involved in cell wall biosynthesis